MQTIIVDDRERGSKTLETLSTHQNVELRIARLTIGDYRIPEGLVFERKRLADLVQSIKDGRLFRQAKRLAGLSDKGVLLLEGTTTEIRHYNMAREAIQGALVNLSLVFGIPVLRALDEKESAQLIVSAADQLRHSHNGVFKRSVKRYHGKKTTQIHVLQGLPGVGRRRAQDLLKHFGDVQSVVKASPEQLEAVTGIGKDTAQKIHWAVSENRGQYQLNNGCNITLNL